MKWKRKENGAAGKIFRKIWTAVFVILAVTAAGKAEVSADTLTMTVERFSIGGGFLVEPTVVEFTPGESYADVFKRVLEKRGISPEITDSSQYGLYLEGIHDADVETTAIPECVGKILNALNIKVADNEYAPMLKEFSYTKGSGWMYYVNNKYVPVGIVNAYPEDGDVARFMFTLCYGADLTGEVNADMDVGEIPSSEKWYQTIDKSELIRVMGVVNEDRARWAAAAGFDEAYNKALDIMAQMDYKDTYELFEAAALLEEIGNRLPPLPETIQLDRDTMELPKGGDPGMLSYNFLPEGSVTTVIWGSENPQVAEVRDGQVIPKSRGTAVIYAETVDGKRAECEVTVLPTPPERVMIESEILKDGELKLKTDDATVPLIYKVLPETADIDNIYWESSNPAVAAVDHQNGTVTPIAKGTADVSITVNGKIKDTCRVIVDNAVQAVAFTQTYYSLDEEDVPVFLEYELIPADAETSLKWISSNPSVAEVSNGYLTVHKAGEANITVTTDNGKSAGCRVTVRPSAKNIFTSGQPVMQAVYNNGVQISWKSYENAAAYQVLRLTSGSGVWEKLARVGADILSYVDQTAEKGKGYTYTVQAIADQWGDEAESQPAKTVYLEIPGDQAPASPITVGNTAISKVTSAAYNKLKITWSKAAGATGYIVYRSTSAKGSYQVVRTIGNGAALSYTDTNLKTGTAYYYKIRAIHTEDGTTVNGALSAAKSGTPALAQASVKTTAGKKKVVVKWGKVSGASGYVVYRSTAKKGKYKAVNTVKKSGSGKYTDTKRKSKKTYYYKVRAYRMVDGRKVWGAYSGVKHVKVK